MQTVTEKRKKIGGKGCRGRGRGGRVAKEGGGGGKMDRRLR